MRQSNKVDRLIYLLSPHVLNPGTALTQKVKFLQEFFPKPLQTAHSGHLTPPTKEKAIIERYAAVMPSRVTPKRRPCRLQIMQTVQTVQTDYFFLTLDSLFLVLLLLNSIQYVSMLPNTKRKILKMLMKPKNLKSNVNFSMS